MNSSKTADWQALEAYLNEKGTLNWRETLSQFHEVCSAIEQEHSNSKQFGNVSIRAFKVTDTADGIIIEYISNWSAGGVSNTFPDEAYMSPERCLSKTTDVRSDIYTLGCVIYQCLTGSPPFMQQDREKLKEMQVVSYALPPGRRSQKRFIPDEVDDLVNTCMQKDPARRFQSATELRAAIGKTLQIEDDADGETVFKGSKLVELVRSRRKLFALVSVLLLSIGTLALASMHTAGSDEFRNRIESTNNRSRNRYYMNVEAGPLYAAQFDFGGPLEPPAAEKPIEILIKGKDIVLFATTVRPTLRDAVVEAVKRHLMLWKADLRGIDLSGCQLQSSNFEEADCTRANMEDINFEKAHLKQINLSGAKMKRATLKLANLSDAILHRADLEDADLSGAMLLNADFRGAILRNSNLSDCYILDGKFNGADMTDANLTGARLTSASLATANLTDAQKSSVKVITGPETAQTGADSKLEVNWLKTHQYKRNNQNVSLPKGPVQKRKDFKLLDPVEEETQQPPTQQEAEQALTGLTPLEQSILKGLRNREVRKSERQRIKQEQLPQQPASQQQQQQQQQQQSQPKQQQPPPQ